MSFSYIVRSETDYSMPWASRMNHYMKTGKENIHAASILLSLGIIAGLAFMIASIMKRGLKKDFAAIALN